MALWEEKKHTHSWNYAYYWDVYPHYNVYTCLCGESYTNGESSNYIWDCAECNPVGASTVTLSSDKLAVGAPVTVSWKNSANTNSYTLKYYNDNNEYTTVCNTTANSYKAYLFNAESLDLERSGYYFMDLALKPDDVKIRPYPTNEGMVFFYTQIQYLRGFRALFKNFQRSK